jgi:hypothetical protein
MRTCYYYKFSFILPTQFPTDALLVTCYSFWQCLKNLRHTNTNIFSRVILVSILLLAKQYNLQ